MGGADLYYKGDDLAVLCAMPNYYAWIMETFAPWVRGHVVEYGAGTGTVSERLLPLSERLVLVEPSANLAALLTRRFADRSEVEIAVERLESHASEVATDSVDCVVLVNVLEHVEDDQAALCHLVRILKPGGHLLIFVPALQFLTSKLDRSVGHFRRYHRSELKEKISEAGGRVLACSYFDAVGVLPWLFLNTLLGSSSFNPTFVMINDTIVVPLTRALERVVSPPFGKNLILAAEKPG